jgi:hypothetical protein
VRGYRFLGIVLVVVLGGETFFPLEAGEQKGLSAQPTRPSPSPPSFHPSPFALEPRLGVILPAFSARVSPLLQVEGLYRIPLGREQKGRVVLSAGGGIMGYGLREKKTIASDQVPPSPIELSSWIFGVYGVGEVSSSAVPPWFLPFFQLGVGTGWIVGSVRGFDTTAPFREETPLLRFDSATDSP